jgi:hypothetical protein
VREDHAPADQPIERRAVVGVLEQRVELGRVEPAALLDQSPRRFLGAALVAQQLVDPSSRCATADSRLALEHDLDRLAVQLADSRG